jgi:hypothetical protein
MPENMLVLNGPFREDFGLLNHDSILEGRLKEKFGNVLIMETDIIFPQPDSLFQEIVSQYPVKKIFVFEEGYGRVIYLQLLDLMNRLDANVKVLDCSIPFEPRIYERFSYIDHILNV